MCESTVVIRVLYGVILSIALFISGIGIYLWRDSQSHDAYIEFQNCIHFAAARDILAHTTKASVEDHCALATGYYIPGQKYWLTQPQSTDLQTTSVPTKSNCFDPNDVICSLVLVIGLILIALFTTILFALGKFDK